MKNVTRTSQRNYLFFVIVYILGLPLGIIPLGTFGSALKLLAILPVFIAIFMSKSTHIEPPLLKQLLFTLFATASIVWSVDMDGSIDRAISYFLLWALVFSGSFFQYDAEDIKKIKNALIWSSRLTVIVILLFAEVVNGRLWLNENNFTEDPNYMCAYLACGIVGALQVLTQRNALKRKCFAILELIIYLWVVLLSGSRGGLLAILASAIVFLLFYSKKYFLRKVIWLIISGVLLLSLLNYLPEDLRMRFTVENVAENGGTGRVELWKQAIDLHLNSNAFRMFFGYGTATIIQCFGLFGYAEQKVVHNIFLETLVELGTVGLILYTAAIFSFIRAAWKQKDKFSFAVIMGMVVMSLSTSIYTFKPYFNIMLFITILQNAQQNYEAKGKLQDDSSLQYRKIYRCMR